MAENFVWEFTNQRKLTKKEFINYIERKVFRTIRKFDGLPKDKIFLMKENDNLNTTVLKYILEKKFEVRLVKTGKINVLNDNLSDVAEKIIRKSLKGDFIFDILKNKKPLYYVSDIELELYAKLVGIKGEKKKRDEKIQKLFEKFFKKNPDLELNVLKAYGQING